MFEIIKIIASLLHIVDFILSRMKVNSKQL